MWLTSECPDYFVRAFAFWLLKVPAALGHFQTPQQFSRARCSSSAASAEESSPCFCKWLGDSTSSLHSDLVTVVLRGPDTTGMSEMVSNKQPNGCAGITPPP